jgi:hypothetical protein
VSVFPSFLSITKGTWVDDVEVDLKEIESEGCEQDNELPGFLEYNFLTTCRRISFLYTINWMQIASLMFGSCATICRRWISLILLLVFVCICGKIGSV